MENDKQEHDIKVKEQMGRTEQKYRTEIEAKEAEITEINESLGLIFAKLADVQAALEHEKSKFQGLALLTSQTIHASYEAHCKSAKTTFPACAWSFIKQGI